MSVTLKLADEDAAVVGSILKAVSEKLASTPEGGSDYKEFALRIMRSSGNRTPAHLADIAGAFQIAVRANAR